MKKIFSERVHDALYKKGKYKKLEPRELEVVQKYYGINSSRYTLTELGEEYLVTKERIRQIKVEALSKIGVSPRD